MSTDQRILAVIPAYNEEVHVGTVVRQVLNFLPVLVIDDGSKDRTAQMAREAGAVVLTQNPNQGKGKALKRAFGYAEQNGFDAVITLDADGQHDPLEIPAFLQSFAQNKSDLIIGAREFKRMPFIRRAGNTAGRLILSWAVGQDIRDNQSGYRLISRRLMLDMLESQEEGFEFEVEMLIRCLKNGYKLDWVSIKTIYADEKSHIKPLAHIRHFFRIASWSRKMLKGSKQA